jgi:serine/threonine protein phosphatase PrpC
MTDGPSCPACGSSVTATDQFCESCGAPLGGASVTATARPEGDARTHFIEPPSAGRPEGAPDMAPEVAPSPLPPCAACGGAVDEERWCTVCGLRAPSPRDHWSEQPAAWVGAVCDRGIRHARNEDAMATAADEAAGSFCALVVCDGVTTAAASDIASLAACNAALEVLTADRGAADGSPAARVVHWTSRIEAASLAANRAATAVAATVPPDAEPPSCTFVAAVLDGPFVVAGWAGDSRAYWFPDDGQPVQLTVDDSWATDQVALGMSRETAEADPRAHSITRWLGADAGDAPARCASMPIAGPGWLLVCSDGLWNYCSPAADLRTLVHTLIETHGDDPVKVADALVAFANQAGGHDNITVALAHVPAAQAHAHAHPRA